MPLFLRGRIVTWCSVLLLFPLAGLCTFFFAWNLSRKWENPDNVTKIFKIAAMILNGLFAVKCILMVHSLRLKSKALSFALFGFLGVAATVANCCWFAFMITRKGYDQLCESGEKACQQKVLSITFSAFLIVYAILTFLVMLVVFYFDAAYNYGPPPAAAPTAPPQPYTQIPQMTAQSLRKFLPSSSRLNSWSPFNFHSRGADSGQGHHVPLINITHDYEDDEAALVERKDGKNTVLFDSAGPNGNREEASSRQVGGGKDDDFATSSTDEEEDESDEEAQLEYERRRRERKGKYNAEEEV